MKRRTFLISLILVFAAEIASFFMLAAQDTDQTQDTILVNEALHTVQNDWNALERHQNKTGLDYVVLNTDGTVLFKTRAGLSETLSNAISHRDTILDIQTGGSAAGKMIIYNDSAQRIQSRNQTLFWILLAAIILQCVICAGYTIYLNRTVIKPFHTLKGFAQRIAGGNLDIPLKMDRQNLFGAFTESFDIMRSELKKARLAEAEANASKKELVAKLSHDIKTPVASIKAASEVGAALTGNERTKDNYTQIIHKADQINTLINNLFTATLEELSQLPVTPEDMDGKEVKTLLENSDYLHRAVIPDIPDCLIYADILRLQQVFDNIFANSYKYADTAITLSILTEDHQLKIVTEDFGGGVPAEELSFLKEKFRRGSNAGNIEGAGLGLYISDYFMREMHGELILENGSCGLKITVAIPLSGTI